MYTVPFTNGGAPSRYDPHNRTGIRRHSYKKHRTVVSGTVYGRPGQVRLHYEGSSRLGRKFVTLDLHVRAIVLPPASPV
jgi:hypothetical protein